MGRNYQQEYANYHSSPIQKKKRAARNAARNAMIKAGKVSVGDGKDVAHKDNNPFNNGASNLKIIDASKNRSFARTKNGKRKK